MANIAKWGTPALSTLLSTELNSLSNGATATATVATFDNTTTKYLYCDIEVVLAALSPTAGSYITVYFLEAVDATNFPAPVQADITQQHALFAVNIPTGTTASTAQRIVARHIPLVPAKFQGGFCNATGAALAASGNTVKLLAYGQNLNG